MLFRSPDTSHGIPDSATAAPTTHTDAEPDCGSAAVGDGKPTPDNHWICSLHGAVAAAVDAADARDALERVPQGEVLKGPELREVVLARAVDEGVFIDPADAGGIRPQRCFCLRWQPRSSRPGGSTA